MPDIRYHFIYLIAVFLMLSLGIVVGASFVGPDQVKKQTKYIQDLKGQANMAVQQGRSSQDQVAKLSGALDDLRPALVRGKLAGQRVTLIQTGDYAEATQDAAGALRDAGASPVVTVLLGGQWDVMTDDKRSAAIGPLVQALTGGTALAANAQALQGLQDQELVTVTGDLAAPCTLFVLVGGGKDDDGDPTGLDTALIAALKNAPSVNATVVGCEPYGAAYSFIPAYQAAQVATVDCIDQPLGRLTLPFALRGDADDYGLKATAKRQVPVSLEAQNGP